MMQIARASQVAYPTACRLVQTLLYEGLIEREPSRKRYRPTALVQTLAHGFQGDSLLVKAARPHIVDLTRAVGWPITLTTRVGHSMVIRDSTHALTSLTFNAYYPGYAMPILDSASGLVTISFLPIEERQSILDSMRLLPNFVPLPVIDLLEGGGLADDIRAKGYAVRDFNRFTQNPGKTSSIAVPILDGETAIGALTLAFFSSATKMNRAEETFVSPLQEAAARIREDMVGKAATPPDGEPLGVAANGA